MVIQDIKLKEKPEFNKIVTHPLQSFEWGEFREKTGIQVIRRGFYENGKLIKAFTLTIHKIPKLPFTIGYLPKGDLPDNDLLTELTRIGKKHNCIFIQLEPNIEKRQMANGIWKMEDGKWKIYHAAHPLFTKYTFILDLTKSEEELLKAMHPKARYNIRVAQKHGVEIKEDKSDEAFEHYLRLMKETTTRQKFYAHTEKYHKLMWDTLKNKNSNIEFRNSKQIQKANNRNSKRFENLNLEHSNIVSDLNQLTAHLFTAKYQGKVLTAWILFVFKDTLYYPYGASSSEHREVMSGNLIMWEAIRYGKKLGLKKFDMWGAMGPYPDPKDPWFGFHNFKQKYGPEHVEFIGSYDLAINPLLYTAYKLADKLRGVYLKLKK